MIVTATKQDLIDELAAEAVDGIGPRARGGLDRDDLFQIAQLAVLEARLEIPHLDPVHDRDHIAWRIKQAIDDQLDGDRAGRSRLTLDQAARRPELRADDVSEQIVERAEAAHEVNRMLGRMPGDTANVVRLVFGLDGDDPIPPADVADILDLPADEVDGHLWVAERLFRHFSEDRRLRRREPLTEREFQAFREAGDLAWYDLRDLNLNNADLGRCDLTQAVLSGMNLWGLKLVEVRGSGIILWGSQLDGADLRGADLRKAYLERTGLCGADLRWADLSEANLWRADLSSASGDYATLAGANLQGANLVGVNLTGADLSGADLRGANLRRARLVGADLSGADLQGADLRGADLRWADLSGADLCWLDLSMTDLRGASMQGAIRSPKLESLLARRVPRPERFRPLAASA